MQYYVAGKIVKINTSHKPFTRGSEGNLYLIDGFLYKIYHSNALNEGFGNKKNYHQALLGIHSIVHQFVLPDNLIFDLEGNYCGYRAPLVGDKKEQKTGISSLTWDKVIENITGLEKEVKMLTENRFLLVDFAFHNSIFSKTEEKLYLVDPGRYHHQAYFTVEDYRKRNQIMLEEYFLHLLEREMIDFKLVPNKKVSIVARMISHDKDDMTYSEYFSKEMEHYDNMQEFLKVKGKYIR